MNTILKGMFAGVLLVLTSAPQFAVADQAGYYGAIDVGQSNAKEICDPALIGPDTVVSTYSCKNKPTSFRASLGYQFNDHIGLEIGFNNAGTIASSFAGTKYVWVCPVGVPCVYTPFSASGTGSDKLTDLQFVVIGYLPESNGFSLFGKAGFNRWSVTSSGSVTVNGVSTPVSVSDSAFVSLVGLGARYRINDKLAIRAQFETHRAGSVTTTGVGTVDMVSMGLTYKF